MSSLPTQPDTEIIINAKADLYTFYYEIQSKITGKESKISTEEYESKLLYTSISDIINYIKQSIVILIETRISQAIAEYTSRNHKPSTPSANESYVRKWENDIRMFLKDQFQNKIQKEAFDCKILYYMEMEQEFEEMKEKFKYDNGKFLQNDRKDNEILIIRSENTKWKSVIERLEKEKESYNESKNEYERDITKWRDEIASWKEKIEKMERINISINANKNNSEKGKCKWQVPRDEGNKENGFMSHYEISNYNTLNPKQQIPRNIIHKLLTNTNSTSNWYTNTTETKASKTNNMNSYLNKNTIETSKINGNYSFNKGKNVIPNPKFPISNRGGKMKILTKITKLYTRSLKRTQSAIGPILSIRGTSSYNN